MIDSAGSGVLKVFSEINCARMSSQPSYNHTAYFGKCYSITKKDIIDISEAIGDITKSELSFRIELGDNSSISSDDVEILLSDTILNIESISSLRISASSRLNADIDSLAITFQRSGFLGPISLSISGRRDAVGVAKTRLSQLLEGNKRWFWLINHSGNFASFACYLILAVILSGFLAWLVIKNATDAQTRAENIGLAGLCYMFFLVAQISLMKDVRNFLFPKLEFRIGRSGQSTDRRDVIRNFILVTVILGSSISIFSSFVYDKIK